MAKIIINCRKCGKEIKLDFTARGHFVGSVEKIKLSITQELQEILIFN